MGCCFGSWKKKESEEEKQSDDARRKCKATEGSDQAPTDRATQSQSLTLSGGPDTRRYANTFTYDELVVATNDFSQDTFLGQGGFGCVYKGKLRTGQVVAVKKLDHSGVQGDNEFLVEVLMLSLLRHPNLVNLIGYCAEGVQRLLVYEFMPLGCLEEHLHDLRPGAEPLSWNLRMMIAAGTARGLDYLHRVADPPVIYRDMKTANILLNEEYQPKLSDFGLAKFGPTDDRTHVSTRVMGTQGYCAPEYALTGKLTMKSDIYSFGVVMLELITGRRALDNSRASRERYLVEWARPFLFDKNSWMLIADPLMKGRYSRSILRKAMDLTAMCLQENASARPTTSELTTALDYLVSRLNEASADPTPSPSPRNFGASTSSNNNSPGALQRQRAVDDARLWGQKWRDHKRVN